MNKLRYLFLFLFQIISGVAAIAQAGGITKKEEPSDFMMSNGKLYVVVAVVVLILLGLFAYLFNLDKKISKLEKQPLNK